MAISLISGTEIVLVGSNKKFQVIQLFKNYPNTRSFCLFNELNETILFPKPMKFIETAFDNITTIFALSEENEFESYDITNKTSPRLLSSYKPSFKLYENFRIFKNYAYFFNKNIYIMNISDVSNITYAGAIVIRDEDQEITFVSSNLESRLFLFRQKINTNRFLFSMIDFSSLPSVQETPYLEMTSPPREAVLTKKKKI